MAVKIIHKVPEREVVRCLLISGTIRDPRRARKYLRTISRKEFLSRLRKQRSLILGLSDTKLGALFQKVESYRYAAYHEADWYLADVPIEEMGVWRRAGGLPLSYTNRSLKETAEKVSKAFTNSRATLAGRSRDAIQGILRTSLDIVRKDPYLYPILFVSGAGTDGRRYLAYKTKFDIDDGCMRSVARAVSGERVIRAYIGFPKGTRVRK